MRYLNFLTDSATAVAGRLASILSCTGGCVVYVDAFKITMTRVENSGCRCRNKMTLSRRPPVRLPCTAASARTFRKKKSQWWKKSRVETAQGLGVESRGHQETLWKEKNKICSCNIGSASAARQRDNSETVFLTPNMSRWEPINTVTYITFGMQSHCSTIHNNNNQPTILAKVEKSLNAQF
jgi:hypothetical protein